MSRWCALGLLLGGCYSFDALPQLCEPLGDATLPSRAPIADGPPIWLPAPSLPSPLSEHAAAQLAGRPYVVGGSNGSMAVRDVRSFDEARGKWVDEPSLSTPRQHLAAAVGRDGRLFAIGGGVGFASTKVESFAPLGSWQVEPSLPQARWALAAVQVGDQLMAHGGQNENGQAFGTLFALGPKDTSWRLLATRPDLHAFHAAAVASDGHVLIIDAGGNETFDASGKFDKLPSLLEPRDSLAAVSAPDGRVYAIGGSGGSRSVESYAPGEGKWSRAPTLRTGRSSVAAALGSDGRIYAIGGRGADDVALSSVEVFGPVVSVVPPIAGPGETVRLMASNFAVSADVVVSSEAGCVVARGRTDSTGVTELRLRVPQSTGFYRLRAVDLVSRYPIFVSFEVR